MTDALDRRPPSATTATPSSCRRPAFPMRGDLPKREPQILARWEQMDLWSRLRAASRGPAEVHPARRPALRERQHPYRHRAEQDPQGRHQPHPPDGRLRRRLHPRLGLPRPADRVEDRGAVPRGEEGQGRRPGAAVPRRVPRLCRALAGGADGGVPPSRRRGQLARALRHHGPSVRGRDRRRDLQVPAERRAVSRPAAGDVVAGREDRAGRGRDRVPRPHLAHDLGALPGAARRTARELRRRVGGDLDHHALDHARQPRDRRRRGRSTTRWCTSTACGAELAGARVGEKLVVALELLPQFCKDTGIATHHVAHVFKGADLAGTVCAHPLRGRGYDFDVPVLLGDFVTTEAGTGFVHIAPGHGEEDFDARPPARAGGAGHGRRRRHVQRLGAAVRRPARLQGGRPGLPPR